MTDTIGAVYTTTNGLERNEVVHYERKSDGTLVAAGWRATSGKGVGDTTEAEDPLGSQGCLALSSDNSLLLAVNAGSDDVSVLRVAAGGGLGRVSVTPAGGLFPSSLATYGRCVYVLNAGGDGLVQTFSLDDAGGLEAIAESGRSLDVGGANPPPFPESPAQVGCDPSGRFLVVTVKKGNFIHVFPLDDRGVPSQEPVTTNTVADLPFSYAFSPSGHLLVCEPFGRAGVGEGGSGALSSYALADDGTLQIVAETVGNHQTATCWVRVSSIGPFAYATNNGSATVSGYRVGSDGSLNLLTDDGVSAPTAHAPLDLAITPDGRYLYCVNYVGAVNAFRIEDNGDLSALGEYDGGSGAEGAVGIAVS